MKKNEYPYGWTKLVAHPRNARKFLCTLPKCLKAWVEKEHTEFLFALVVISPPKRHIAYTRLLEWCVRHGFSIDNFSVEA